MKQKSNSEIDTTKEKKGASKWKDLQLNSE